MEQKRSAVLNFPFRNDAVLSVDGPHCPGSEARISVVLAMWIPLYVRSSPLGISTK
ncbi:hypothetical protein [Acidithiobacillus thiooxidans]|uniref:hypothetical protein n=1 Tax=Acidithiobacillus thiooxidans TaxID=930 RepID=UPI0013019AB8|nr:hypothetical protein [Acidithiobacillus thiooxidans]